jgi:hypothetical protein
MSPASSDASMLAVALPAPLRPTLLAVDSCALQHANLLVLGQIVSGLVIREEIMWFNTSLFLHKRMKHSKLNNESIIKNLLGAPQTHKQQVVSPFHP